MPNLLHFAVIVDRAQWLASEHMYDVARDHYLLGAELAREAGMVWLETLQLQAAADCQARMEQIG